MRNHTAPDSLLHPKDLPLWQQNSKYILSGYRPSTTSYAKSIQSLLYLHNQTVNIYTHLFRLCLFGLLACALRDSLYGRCPTATNEDVMVFSAYFAGVFACFSLSSAFHKLLNHSKAIYDQWLVLDFLGILCLIAGSWVPGVYYGFYCQRTVSQFYLIMITSLSTICAIFCLVPYCRTPDWRHFRTIMFLSLGISGFFPMNFAATELGIKQAHSQMGWGWFILKIVFYISGAGIYVFKYPEKVRPGNYDILGSSNQVFHVLVVLRALSHLIGIVQAFEYNHGPLTRLC
ncbi:HlyIII-domain-containing protein [Ophiobolus disseminans]|uniref:HlyIII-domain-containing protein n=1 Tax=Ophiobolus disseminans TaxID=1469910 RepID=A0A6A7A611_9PLEO|nr:HlyIII-domain-containing protein [Ophiobolus disseminans]